MADKRRVEKKTEASSKREMVVIAKGDRPMHDIAADLRSAGFQVQHVLDAVRQVTGHADASLKPRLKKIPGVDEVSDTHEQFNIGPPDAAVS